MHDIARQAPPGSDSVGDIDLNDTGRRIPIKEVLPLFRAAGLPRDIRSLQRYCENRLLDGIKELTATGETWFVAEDSIQPAITQLRQMHLAKGTRPTTTVPEAPGDMSPVVVGEQVSQTGPVHDGQGATASDTAGPQHGENPAPERPTNDDTGPGMSGHVAQLEKRLEDKDDEISFLRGEVATKNRQLADASERDRETNILIQGLQGMVLQLTGNDRPAVLAEYHAPQTALYDDRGDQAPADEASPDANSRNTHLPESPETSRNDSHETPPPSQTL